MTARETTLGALTAADLGKRVVVVVEIPRDGRLCEVRHSADEGTEVLYTKPDGPTFYFFEGDPTTPVTVYDEEEA